MQVFLFHFKTVFVHMISQAIMCHYVLFLINTTTN